MEIILRGQEIVVSLNGGQVNHFDPDEGKVPERNKDYEPERGPRPTSGYIGLQNHGDVSREGLRRIQGGGRSTLDERGPARNWLRVRAERIRLRCPCGVGPGIIDGTQVIP